MKVYVKKVILSVVICLFACLSFQQNAMAAKMGTIVYSSWGYPAGRYNAKGQIEMKVCKSKYKGKSPATVNTNALQKLLNGTKKKTIVIPSGSSIKLKRTLQIHSNTTVLASGAKIMISAGKNLGIMNNRPRKVKYNALKNVTIKGGTWTTSASSGHPSLFRIAHAQNINFANASIITTYQGHGIELIACKNCKIENCKAICKGKTHSGCSEEVIQIDIAERHTAPGIAAYGKKYVNGATCKNILISRCKVVGSRGIAANIAKKGSSSMRNKFHSNITIKNCNVTGKTAEAVTLHNTTSATVSNNKLTSKCRRKSGGSYNAYTLGLNIMIEGRNSAVKKGTISVINNVCKGGRSGLQVTTFNSYKYKLVNVRSNTVYYKGSKRKAIVVNAGKKANVASNKYHKW